MSTLKEKKFLQLIKFSFDLSLKVTRTFTKTNVLNTYNNSFVDFLNANKHEIYHLWNNNIRCCVCTSNALLKNNRDLNKEQFTKLFDINGNATPGHCKKGQGKYIVQYCFCGISCIESCSLDDLDVILIHTLLRKFVKLNSDDEMWLDTIRNIRNNLAHVVSTTCFDQGRLDKWWFKLEGSVLGLAGKIPPEKYYAESIEGQIKLLGKIDFNIKDEEIRNLIETENKKLYDQIIKEHDTKFQQIMDKQDVHAKNNIDKSETIKEEIIKHLTQTQGQVKEEIVKEVKEEIIKELKESHIVCRICRRADAAEIPCRKDAQAIEASCQVTGENIDEELILSNLQQKNFEQNSGFNITSAKKKCILLELSSSPDIFQSRETFRRAILSLITRIEQAGELDSSIPYSIEFNLTFNSPLTQDEVRTVSSLSTLRQNGDTAQETQADNGTESRSNMTGEIKVLVERASIKEETQFEDYDIMLQKGKENEDDLLVEIRKLTFPVKLHGMAIKMKSETTETTIYKTEDSDRCQVEWRLRIPDIWKVDQIKHTLENVSQVLHQLFRIEFIYVGGPLVIHTSVPRHVLRDKQVLESAIQSFLEKIVEVCEIDTDVPETVNVDFRVLEMTSHTETDKSEIERLKQLAMYSEKEYTTDEDTVSCKHCHKQFPCDQCSRRRKQIDFLVADNRRKTETITGGDGETRTSTQPEAEYINWLKKNIEIYKGRVESLDQSLVNCRRSKARINAKHRQLKQSSKEPTMNDHLELVRAQQIFKRQKIDFDTMTKQLQCYQTALKSQGQSTEIGEWLEKGLDTADTESFDSVRCQLCVSDPRPAVYLCTECVQAMCRECTTVHRTQPTSSTHTTVLLTHDYNFQIKGIDIWDIASLCEGVLIIIDDRGNQLITSDIRGHNKQFIPLPHLPHTCRLSVIDQNNVAVTTYSHKKVLIVDVRQKNITKAIDIKKYCWGIMYRDNHLYVGCINSLVKVDMSGEIIRTVPLSFIPIYMCSGTEGRIYCSDSHTVYCIDTEGNTVFTVTYPDMLRPCGITTDNEGHVLVVCRLSNNVHRISPDGKQCNVIIKDIPSGIESYPRICYDSISKSVVIGRDDKVYIYKI